MSEPITHDTALAYLLDETAAGADTTPADATPTRTQPLDRGSQRPARPPGAPAGLGVTPAEKTIGGEL